MKPMKSFLSRKKPLPTPTAVIEGGRALDRWYSIIQSDRDGSTADVWIFDEIGGWGVWADEFIEELRGLRGVTDLNLHIFSPGGSVFQGVAIFNAVRAFPAKVNVIVEGMAASIASYIAMAGDTITMPENSFMMIHNPWTQTAGGADDLRKDADLLDKIRMTLVSAYVARTGQTEDAVIAMMDAETWMTGAEALELGFADEVTPALEVAARLKPENAFEKMPDAAKMFMEPPPKADQSDGGNDDASDNADLDKGQASRTDGTNNDGANNMSDATRTEEENAIYDAGLEAGKAENETAVTARIEVATAEAVATITTERDELQEKLDALTTAHEGVTAKLTEASARADTLEAGLKFTANGSGDSVPTPGEDEPATFKEAIAKAITGGMTAEAAQIHCQTKYPALHAALIGFNKEDTEKRVGK